MGAVVEEEGSCGELSRAAIVGSAASGVSREELLVLN